jgi:hypothetical protein
MLEPSGQVQASHTQKFDMVAEGLVDYPLSLGISPIVSDNLPGALVKR